MIELMRGVLYALLQNTVAPAIAQSGDLDEAVKALKKAVVAYSAHQSEASKETLARHFGKSGRWVYLHLDAPKSRKRRRDKTSASESLMESAADTTQSLLRRVLHLAANRYPEPLTLEDIEGHLQQEAASFDDLDRDSLQSLLGLYANMGMLKVEAMGADGELTGFAAPSRVTQTQARTAEQRLELIAYRARAIFPIALRYVLGEEDARFSSTHVRLKRRHLLAALADCRQFIVERFNEAVEASLDDDPDETLEGDVVDYTLLLLGGIHTFDDPSTP